MSFIKDKKTFESKNIKEDMLMPVDVSSPGEIYQTPLSMPSNMDTYSLLGPGKKKAKKKSKKKSKKKMTAVPGERVMTFTDFLNGRK